MYLPVIMGIVSEEQMQTMTADEIGIAYHLAKMKQQIFAGRGDVNG